MWIFPGGKLNYITSLVCGNGGIHYCLGKVQFTFSQIPESEQTKNSSRLFKYDVDSDYVS
jgi:hypothetical protein